MQYSSLSIGLQVGLQHAVATQQSPTQVVSNVAVFKAANTLQSPMQVALHIHYVFQENMCSILHNAGLSLEKLHASDGAQLPKGKSLYAAYNACTQLQYCIAVSKRRQSSTQMCVISTQYISFNSGSHNSGIYTVHAQYM